MPPAPDLTAYVPGTNAFKFGPQGGLRISALELATIQRMMRGQGTLGNVTILRPESVMLMRSTFWLYNGQNGETDSGLFQAWGLGTQIITGKKYYDQIFPNSILFGHAGDAYGLISDSFFDPVDDYGLVWITNGPKNTENFPISKESAFYEPEALSFDALNKYSRSKCI